MPKAVRGISIKEKHGTATYILIDDLAGLVSLVQMGVLEIHPWGSREDRLDRPDRLIFDLDPAEDLVWDDVVRAARHIRERLEDLGLDTFVRTTGGKGLHVVVPLHRRVDWQELKALARAFADAIVREQPTKYIAQSSKVKRPAKFISITSGTSKARRRSLRIRRGRGQGQLSPRPFHGTSCPRPGIPINSIREPCQGDSKHDARSLGRLFRDEPNDHEGDADAGRAVVTMDGVQPG